MCRTGFLVLLTCLATTGASAHVDDPEQATLPSDRLARPADEVPRVTLTVLPPMWGRGRPGYRTDTSELSYRWWGSGAFAHVGFSLSSALQVSHPTGLIPGTWEAGDRQWSGNAASLLLAVRVRTSERSTVYADAAIVRGPDGENNGPAVGKLGFELKTASSRWDMTYSGLGLRLSGDAGVSLRLRRGGMTVNWRQSF